jgi:Predicted dehydrogenase
VSSDLGSATDPDVVLVGGGIMSATLAALLGVVAPGWTVTLFESADDVAGESSDAWNNAGTGHAALCELNYTPLGADGRVDTAKARTVNEQFQVSRQFWAHLVRTGLTGSPKEFISPVPHVGFVTGEEGRAYMRARHAALSAEPLFAGLEYTDSPTELAGWVPLVMDGRDGAQAVAATRSVAGTDVDFGTLTRLLLTRAQERGLQLHTGQRVTGLERLDDGRWQVTVTDRRTGEERSVRTRFVFVGAGGARCRCCRRRRSPRSAASAASRSAACSCARGRRSWSPGTRRRSTAGPPSAHRRCPCRTWTCAWSTASTRCCSAPTPASPPGSSRPARCSTCRGRSGRATSARCSGWRAPSWR